MLGAAVLKIESRVHLEIINKCRKEVGEDFPISVKLNSTDFQKGGFTPDESIQVAQDARKCWCRYYRNFRWYL